MLPEKKISLENGANLFRFFFRCRDPESNWGHGDFQSPALPTELSRQSRVIIGPSIWQVKLIFDLSLIQIQIQVEVFQINGEVFLFRGIARSLRFLFSIEGRALF